MKAAIGGVALAALAFPWVFRSGHGNFWARMPLVAGALGLYASVARPELRRTSTTPLDVLTAIVSAVGLYGVFQVGDRVARVVMPRGDEEIGQIYDLRERAPRWLIAMLLVGIIGPCEELFWRGLVQDSFMQRLGRFRGTAVAAACYGGVHLASGNVTLTGAATTAGVFWGLQYAFQRRLSSLIVSHIIWDVWIFLIAPTQRRRVS